MNVVLKKPSVEEPNCDIDEDVPLNIGYITNKNNNGNNNNKPVFAFPNNKSWP